MAPACDVEYREMLLNILENFIQTTTRKDNKILLSSYGSRLLIGDMPLHGDLLVLIEGGAELSQILINLRRRAPVTNIIFAIRE